MNTKETFKDYADKEVLDRIVSLETIPEFMEHIKKYGSSNAVQRKDLTIATFNDLLEDTNRIMSFLGSNDINGGAHIGIYCNNNYEFAYSSLGVMAYGAVAVLIPPQIPKDVLPMLCMKYNIKHLLYEDVLKENTEGVENRTCISNIEAQSTAHPYNVTKDSPACIIMTGGTTGKSKGALLSHGNILSGVINGCFGINDVFNQVYYSIMPLTHVFGFIRNLLTSLYTGSNIYFNYSKANIFKDMQTYNPSVVVVVPALAEMMLGISNQFGMQMLGNNLKLIIAGGANVPQYLVEEFYKKGITLCPGYGLTELANMVSGNPKPLEKPNSVGLLFPGIEAKIEDGELLLKGPNLMIEYFNSPDENEKAFDGEYFKTGDLARFDDDGYLYITGRTKDVIVLPNGENISPAELENNFVALPFIQDALVYEDDGHLVLEVLPRKSEMGDMTIDDIKNKLNEVNEKLNSYERVNEIIIRDKDFERSPSMKIIRPGSKS